MKHVYIFVFGILFGAAALMASEHVTETKWNSSKHFTAVPGDKVQFVIVRSTWTETLEDWTVPGGFTDVKGHISGHGILE